jgi:hypothetical protein
MSSSLLSSSFVQRLGVQVHKGLSLSLQTAGDGTSIFVDDYVTVEVAGLMDHPFEMKFGVTSLPVDAIIGWSDIRSFGLFGVLMSAGAAHLPSMKEVAPEEGRN